MSLGQHHQHMRTRGYGLHGDSKKQTSHEEKTFVRVLDILMFWAGIFSACMNFPQTYIIYETQNVAALSLASWLTFTLVGFMWIVYGIVHRAKAIIAGHVISFILQGSIVVGILLYG